MYAYIYILIYMCVFMNKEKNKIKNGDHDNTTDQGKNNFFFKYSNNIETK